MIRNLVASLGVLFGASAAVAGCGPSPEACALENGTYHIAVPPSATSNTATIMFLHGYGSSGANVMKNKRLVASILDRGYAIIAPDALPRRGPGTPTGWAFRDGMGSRDEAAFLQSVVEDAATTFGVDPNRTVLSGFSGGGFMVSYLACATPDAFSAYAPVAGGFWKPHPTECSGPVRLHHTHGWTDGVVPLEGRLLGGGRFQQGDIHYGLDLWRDANGCAEHKPDTMQVNGPFWMRVWANCDEGALVFALHPGGHSIPQGWADMTIDWYEALP